MSSIFESQIESKNVHAKKEWAVPQFKKISLEEITAGNQLPGNLDGHSNMS
jgi:hypothetical protein